MKSRYKNERITKNWTKNHSFLMHSGFFLERQGTSGLVAVPRLLEAGLEDDQSNRRVDQNIRTGGVA